MKFIKNILNKLHLFSFVRHNSDEENQWEEKVKLYRDMVSDAGNGFAAQSMSWAKRKILETTEKNTDKQYNEDFFIPTRPIY